MFITPRKLMRALRAIFPAWMMPVIAIALAIPGPQDEAVVALIGLILITVQPSRVPKAISAFKGGKSHRRELFAHWGRLNYRYTRQMETAIWGFTFTPQEMEALT